MPATAEEHVTHNESFEQNLTSGQQSPLGTGNWPQMNYRIQSNTNSQTQPFVPEGMHSFQIKMGDKTPSLTSDLAQETKQPAAPRQPKVPVVKEIVP